MRPSTVYFEVCPEMSRRAGFAPDEPARLLEAAGYELFALEEDGALSPVEPEMAKEQRLANWLARPKAL